MPEIGTSGSMSGDEKRSVAAWPKLPRSSSTLLEAAMCRGATSGRVLEMLRNTSAPLGRIAALDPSLPSRANFAVLQ